MSSDGLRVLRVLDFEPAGAVALVDAEFTLRHDTFQILSANLPEECFTLTLDVLGIDNSSEKTFLDELM